VDCYDLGPVNVGSGYICYGLDALTDSQEVYRSVSLVTFQNPIVTVDKEISHLPAWHIP